MASAAYNQWATIVTKSGGHVVASAGGINPNTGKVVVPSTLSAAFPASVWVARVNAKNADGTAVWPLPDEYSANGQTGYYHAPVALQNEAKNFGVATPAEIKSGAETLMNQWGIPEWLRSPGKLIAQLGSSTVLIVIILGVVYVVANRRKR